MDQTGRLHGAMSEPMYCNQAIARSPVRWPSVDEACLQVHKTTLQGAGESGCGTASQSGRRKWPISISSRN